MEHRQVQIYTNYEKIILKFVVLSIALARSGTILLVSLTHLRKVLRRIILESSLEYAKGL
jgi:hypothetical protein